MAKTLAVSAEQRLTLLRTFEKPKTARAQRFGTHLTLDGYGADEKKLDSMETVWEALDKLPELLNMHKLHPPYVVKFAGNDKKDPGGYSGFVMIAESHVSVHTFPKKRFVSIDVYTCQGSLDVKTTCAFFQQAFGVKEFERHLIQRGTKYA